MTDDRQTRESRQGASQQGASQQGASQQGASREAQGQPGEEELRAAYEAELNRISSAEMILQTAVSLLNLGGHRLGLAGGEGGVQRDLEQVRDAIDGVRALMPILERRMPQELRPLRDAIAQLQMAYAREAAAKPAAEPAAKPADEPAEQPGEDAAGGGAKKGPGPAEASGRLWVPGR